MRRPSTVAATIGRSPQSWPSARCSPGLASSRSATRRSRPGNSALQAGKADDALVHYDKAVKKLPAEAGTHFDRGAALYALSRFDEAGEEFLRATEAKDPALKASAFYNLGNAFFKKEKFKEAVSAYTRSLGLKPDDKQAKWNLEIALRKQKDKEDKDKKDQDQKDKDKKKDDKDKDKTRRTRRKTTRRTIRRRIRTRRTRKTKTRKTRRTSKTRSRRRSRARRRSRSRSSRCSTTSNAAPRTWRKNGPRPGPCGARRRSVTGEAHGLAYLANWSACDCGLATVAPRAAQAATFTAEIDRDAVAPGEPFIYRITLNMGDGDAENFRPPDFHGFQVQQAQGPSKSTSVQFVFGSNQQSVQSTYAWTYQLVLPAGTKGPLTIGAAHVRVAGRDLVTNSVRVRVGAASGQSPPGGSPAVDPNRLFQRLFPGAQGFGPGRDREAPNEVASSPAPAFIRVMPDKTRAFVGEQVTVAWYLYVTEVPNRFGQTSEPHTDGFWSEEIPSTNPQGRLAFGEPQTVAGRSYNVALLFKKALFPLAPGKLTITPMEAEIAHGDFFGPMQVSRLKTEPVVIEAQALPAQGQPPHFDAANVGRYEISASVDRTAVSVGDAVTLKVTVKGTGNVRNVQPPALPPLAGWKSYEPKTDVALDGAETIAGTKTVEWLMRPERGGKTTIPSLVLETFDPAAKRYQTARSQPIEIAVSGEAGANAVAGSAAPPAGGAGVENVVGGSIRPIHARGEHGRRGRGGVPAQRRVQGHRRHAAAGAGGAGAVRPGARATGARFASDAASAHADDGPPAAARGRGPPGGGARR